MFIKSENTSKGFVIWYLQRDVDNHMHDVNLFNHERILSKVKNTSEEGSEEVQESRRKKSGFVKGSFTLQNLLNLKVFGNKVLI